MTNLERFKDNIAENFEGCWLWLLSLNHQGYGLYWADGKYQSAHRWIYEQVMGAIPEGLQLDHLCRRRDCVNPHHLEPVTGKENCRRAMQDYCAHGHKWTDETTYIDKRGQRACIPCMRESTRRWRADKKCKELKSA